MTPAVLGVIASKKRGGAVDPFFSQVVLLMHMDGSNGSTTFTDNSSYARSFVLGGANTSISTAQSQFGGASLRIAQQVDLGIVSGTPTPGSELSFSGDFTWEAFVRPDTSTANRWIVAGSNTSGNGFLAIRTGNTVSIGRNNTAYDVTTSSTVTDGVWSHIAVSRTSGTLKIFIDGVEGASAANTTTYVMDTSICVGYLGGDSSLTFVGYIDEVRLTNGTGRYTANFTPPAAAFPNS